MCCLVFDVALTQSSKMTICNNIILLWTQLLLIVTVLLILDIKSAPKKYLKNFRKGVLPSFSIIYGHEDWRGSGQPFPPPLTLTV